MKRFVRQKPDALMFYRADPEMVHVRDGYRHVVGASMARRLDTEMRYGRWAGAEIADAKKSLCPGCYQTVIFNMATELARNNGQDLRELGLTLGRAFLELAAGGGDLREHVDVTRDITPRELVEMI